MMGSDAGPLTISRILNIMRSVLPPPATPSMMQRRRAGSVNSSCCLVVMYTRFKSVLFWNTLPTEPVYTTSFTWPAGLLPAVEARWPLLIFSSTVAQRSALSGPEE